MGRSAQIKLDAADGITSVLDGLVGSFGNASAAIAAAFGVATLGVSAGAAVMVAAIANVTEAAGKFADEMAKVQGLTEAGGGAFRQMELQAQSLGRQTIFTAQEAAQGM